MLLSGLSFAWMSVAVKKLSETFTDQEIVFYRSILNLILIGAIVAYRREPVFPKGQIKLLVFRGVSGFMGLTCFVYAITHLPLSVASLINWSSPVFVIIISWIALGEKFSAALLKWVLLVFSGLLLITNPDFSEHQTALPVLPILVGLAGAFFGSLAYVAVRKATAKVTPNVIVLYFAGIATLFAAPFAVGPGFHWPTWNSWFWLAVLGKTATLAQVAMTQGYASARAGIVSTMSLANACFAAVLGWIFFSETLAAVQWVGMVIMGWGISRLTLSRQK